MDKFINLLDYQTTLKPCLNLTYRIAGGVKVAEFMGRN